MRFQLSREGLLVKLANHCTTRGPDIYVITHVHKVKLATDRGWLHLGVGEGAIPFPGLLHFTLDTNLIMLSVKQGDIKYDFLSLWYDSIWDWIPVSQAISEYSTMDICTHIYIYTVYVLYGFICTRSQENIHC